MRLKPNYYLIQLFSRKLSKLSYIHKVGPTPLLSQTAGKLLSEAAEKYANRAAIISCQHEKQLTYCELLDAVDAFAAGLKSKQINKGDSLALWAPNSIEWIVTSLACARLGVILVQLNHSYKKNELLYSLNKTKAKALVCGNVSDRQHYYNIIKEVDARIFDGDSIKSDIIPLLSCVVMMDKDNNQFKFKGTCNFENLSMGHSKQDLDWVEDNQDQVQFDDPLNIQFTSGSTGLPKAAVLSHHNVVNNSYWLGHRLELYKKHHIICVQVPLFHTYGTTAGIFTALHFGATLVLPSEFYSPSKGLQAIQDHNCTIIYGTPTMHVDLIEQQKQRRLQIKPEIVMSGGSPTTPKLIDDAYQYLGCHSVVNIYGLTETTAICFQSYIGAHEEHVANTVGHVGEHVEVKVVDENGQIVPFGTPGELYIRGYKNMLGYLDDDEKTKELVGQDRWLKSGDKFVLLEDGTGKIVGRIKEIIIRGGENIPPKEIEDCLSKYPKLIDCQVVGLPHERLGEEICACVRLKPEEKEITLEEISTFCKEHLAHYKIPSKVHSVKEYPKTTSGKIQKFKIIEMLKKEYNIK